MSFFVHNVASTQSPIIVIVRSFYASLMLEEAWWIGTFLELRVLHVVRAEYLWFSVIRIILVLMYFSCSFDNYFFFYEG